MLSKVIGLNKTSPRVYPVVWVNFSDEYTIGNPWIFALASKKEPAKNENVIISRKDY